MLPRTAGTFLIAYAERSVPIKGFRLKNSPAQIDWPRLAVDGCARDDADLRGFKRRRELYSNAINYSQE
jgi:hypothetical protein